MSEGAETVQSKRSRLGLAPQDRVNCRTNGLNPPYCEEKTHSFFLRTGKRVLNMKHESP